MHMVVAADAAGHPLRVACGFCRAEHNYRGGKASSRSSSSGSASGSSAPRRPRAAAEPAEKPKIFKPLNQPPAPSPWAHIFNRDTRPTTTPTPPATPPRAQAPAAAGESDDSEDDQAPAPRLLRRDPAERWGAMTGPRLQPVAREEVDDEDDFRDQDDEDEDDDLDEFEDAESSAEADARAASRAAAAAEAESRRVAPQRASVDDDDEADDEDEDQDDEDEDEDDGRDGGYVLSARSERDDERRAVATSTSAAAAAADADDDEEAEDEDDDEDDEEADADEDDDDGDDDDDVVVRRTLPPLPAAASSRVAEARGRVELPRERTMPVQQKADSMPDDLANLEWLIRKVIREETGLTTVSPAPKWRGGQLVLKPGKSDLQEKSWPIETFFHKVVMLRNRLRTLEQQVNSMTIPEDEKVKLQAYITGCYGSLTSFNVLFADLDDMFKGSGE